MKKILSLILLSCFFVAFPIFAQSDDELFGGDDDMLFGGKAFSESGSSSDDALFDDDDLFSDDDMFTDDGIVESSTQSKDKVSSDLSKGVLFQNGSIKIGGTFNLGMTTYTVFKDDWSFGESLKNTFLIPKADGQFTLDARPSENLRLYAKTGIHYPYLTEANASMLSLAQTAGTVMMASYTGGISDLSANGVLQNLFYVKELFSDFNFGDNVSFRFGKQTVSWGAGYFYSPADVINVTKIDPENPTNQLEGPLALRSQIVFPGTQNALWIYAIPDTEYSVSDVGAGTYLRDTALAAKGDILLGDWELGIGGWYKYHKSPRLMLTATGTIFRNYGIFAEGVVAFGKDNVKENQWTDDYSGNRDLVWQGTIGFMRYWKNQNITFAAQYYYNQQELYVENTKGKEVTYAFASGDNHGHNLAANLSFGKVLISSLSASIFGMYNFTTQNGLASASLTYSPRNQFSVGFGPYMMFTKDNSPKVAARFEFNLGSGKF